MIDEPTDDEPDVAGLYQEICEELGLFFGHPPEDAGRIMVQFMEKYPWHDDDYYFHESPAGAAMRMHYDIVLGLPDQASNSINFLEWRKQFSPIIKARFT